MTGIEKAEDSDQEDLAIVIATAIVTAIVTLPEMVNTLLLNEQTLLKMVIIHARKLLCSSS